MEGPPHPPLPSKSSSKVLAELQRVLASTRQALQAGHVAPADVAPPAQIQPAAAYPPPHTVVHAPPTASSLPDGLLSSRAIAAPIQASVAKDKEIELWEQVLAMQDQKILVCPLLSRACVYACVGAPALASMRACVRGRALLCPRCSQRRTRGCWQRCTGGHMILLSCHAATRRARSAGP